MNLNIGKWISESRRILKLTRRPKQSEFNETARICAIGIVALGFIGFIIFLVAKLV